MVKYHSNEPNFHVYCGCCPRSFTKVNSLQKHFYREHQNEINLDDADNVNPDVNGDINENCNPDNDQQLGAAQNNLKHHVAKYLLCAREKGKLTQTALDMVKDSTKNLLDEYLDIIKKALIAKLNGEIGQEFEFSQDMEELFEADRVFDGLNTEYQQRSYYLENFNLVEPIKEKLGDGWKYIVSNGRKKPKRVSSYGYRVPLLKSLEALLQNADVLNEVDNPHPSDDGVLRDVMDGGFYHTHPIFGISNGALQLFGYYDDLELANPLGSKSKIHKIGVFYYVLGNIRPMYRSTTHTIQLLSIAKTADLKQYGIDSLLTPITQEINSLAKDDGHCFNIHGQPRHFRGGLLLWTGDTLASQYMGGYKEGVGGALRFCRNCMATREESNIKVCCHLILQ